MPRFWYGINEDVFNDARKVARAALVAPVESHVNFVDAPEGMWSLWVTEAFMHDFEVTCEKNLTALHEAIGYGNTGQIMGSLMPTEMGYINAFEVQYPTVYLMCKRNQISVFSIPGDERERKNFKIK